ncbi:L,D-transpeptidase family protein [bacterium]|nr:L,D-transpeptidase family protein [bacterium]
MRIELLSADETPEALGDRVLSPDLIKEYYVQREHRPVWIEKNTLSEPALQLMQEVMRSEQEGLRSRTYHSAAFMSLFNARGITESTLKPLTPDQLIGTELLLTDSFFLLADHYRGGRIDPVSIDPDWEATRSEMDYIGLLQTALRDRDPVAVLQSLLPQQPGYARLRETYLRHMALNRNGGWPFIDDGPTLKPGMRSPRVAQLRARLAITDSIPSPAALPTDSFDAGLQSAVERFQSRHGLTRDGAVGTGTLKQLNVPCDQRIAQLMASLERWRWLPEKMGDRHMYVNIANFELDIIERGTQVWTTRVIVGKHYRKTPVFSSQISYMVLNPTWTVPPTILKNDIIPAVRKNIGYLAEKKMTVYKSTPSGQQPVDPATVDWSKTSIPYSIVQSPGPHNALGAIKFMFPNKYNVYIHDTPSKELFDKDVRAFSSGCIRVEHPVRLAEKLLEADNPATLPVLQAGLKSSDTQTIRLKTAVPVHIIYLTAWVNPSGSVNFREDIYGRDERLLAALRTHAPLDGEEI